VFLDGAFVAGSNGARATTFRIETQEGNTHVLAVRAVNNEKGLAGMFLMLK